MADIERPGAVPTASWRSYGSRPGGGRRGFPYGSGGGADEERRDPHDAVRVLGLNPRAYPEEVQAVLVDLLAQVDALRHDLEQAHHRIDWLEREAERHSSLPVLRRPAFVGHLDRFLTTQAEARAVSTILAAGAAVEAGGEAVGGVAVFYLANYEILHRRVGLGAAEQVLAHMATYLAAAVRSTDVVGSIGGAGLAVLMTTGGEAGLRRKTEILRDDLAARPAVVGGQALPLRVVSAFASADAAGEGGAEAVLTALDANLRSALRADENG